MSDFMTRRTVIKRGLQLYVGALAAGLSACGGSDPATAKGAGGQASALCADPAAMNPGDANARTAYGYVERSPDPQQVCAGCTFYRAGESGGACGSCDIFNGGPANAAGYCTSWTAADAAPAATNGA
jgi:hypothetical protein